MYECTICLSEQVSVEISYDDNPESIEKETFYYCSECYTNWLSEKINYLLEENPSGHDFL